MNVTMGYSAAGVTFTTLNLDTNIYTIVKVPVEVMNHLYVKNGKIDKRNKDRYRVYFSIPDDEFNSTKDPSGTRRAFMQAFNSARYKRVQFSAAFDGYSAFASTNTINLVHEGDPNQMEEDGSDWLPQEYFLISAEYV